MGFLKKFFRSVFHEGAPTAVNDSSFEHLSEDELETHLGVNRYGKFMLTEAVRPSYDLKVIPKQGFRHDHYVDEETKTKVPVLMAAASRENLFDLFIELLDPLFCRLSFGSFAALEGFDFLLQFLDPFLQLFDDL